MLELTMWGRRRRLALSERTKGLLEVEDGRPAASASLIVPLERPPPCPAALEMVRRALLDGVGDNGGGQLRR